MSPSSSESHMYFTSGELAPTAEEALDGAIIPSERGWLALMLDVESQDSTGSIKLDTSTEPPTLHLTNVRADAVWGEYKDGAFVALEQNPVAGYLVLTGEYTGAASTLIAE